MPAVVIQYFETSSNNSPIIDFMLEQGEEAAAKIQERLDYLEEKGLELMRNSNIVKKLHPYDLYELKVKWKGVAYRILFAIKNSVVWLLHAFKKTTNKAPNKEIKIALARKSILSNIY